MTLYLFNAPTLADSVRLAMKELRRELGDRNVSNFTLNVEISGNTLEGDLKVEYSIRERYGDGVQAGTLDAAVEEFLRRRGWKERNQAICLPRVDDSDIKVIDPPPPPRIANGPSDEMPF